jgi:hypothetical protein
MNDEYTRRILRSTLDNAKSAKDISKENSIPISTRYRYIRELIDLQLLRLERIVLTDSGRKSETFRSTIKDTAMSFSDGFIEDAKPDLIEPADSNKLHGMQFSFSML